MDLISVRGASYSLSEEGTVNDLRRLIREGERSQRGFWGRIQLAAGAVVERIGQGVSSRVTIQELNGDLDALEGECEAVLLESGAMFLRGVKLVEGLQNQLSKCEAIFSFLERTPYAIYKESLYSCFYKRDQTLDRVVADHLVFVYIGSLQAEIPDFIERIGEIDLYCKQVFSEQSKEFNEKEKLIEALIKDCNATMERVTLLKKRVIALKELEKRSRGSLGEVLEVSRRIDLLEEMLGAIEKKITPLFGVKRHLDLDGNYIYCWEKILDIYELSDGRGTVVSTYKVSTSKEFLQKVGVPLIDLSLDAVLPPITDLIVREANIPRIPLDEIKRELAVLEKEFEQISSKCGAMSVRGANIVAGMEKQLFEIEEIISLLKKSPYAICKRSLFHYLYRVNRNDRPDIEQHLLTVYIGSLQRDATDFIASVERVELYCRNAFSEQTKKHEQSKRFVKTLINEWNVTIDSVAPLLDRLNRVKKLSRKGVASLEEVLEVSRRIEQLGVEELVEETLEETKTRIFRVQRWKDADGKIIPCRTRLERLSSLLEEERDLISPERIAASKAFLQQAGVPLERTLLPHRLEGLTDAHEVFEGEGEPLAMPGRLLVAEEFLEEARENSANSAATQISTDL